MATNSIGLGKENMAVTLDEGIPELLKWLAAQRGKSRNELLREYIEPLVREASRQMQGISKAAGLLLFSVGLGSCISAAITGGIPERRPARTGRRETYYVTEEAA